MSSQEQTRLDQPHLNYLSSLKHQDVKITEMPQNLNGSSNGENGHATNHQDKNEYIIEEPLDYGYDYIFEPDHNKPSPSPNSHSNDNNNKSGDKFKFATSIGEINGVLEYEYRSFTFKYDKEDDSVWVKEWDLMNQNHLQSNVRGISMIKWPQVGFGFELDIQKVGEESFIYVKNILADSPAEFSLQLGDILIEMDEFGSENEMFQNIDNLNSYMNSKDSIHLFVVHESKYFRLKSENDDLLKNCYKNCEDIVIVSYKKNIE